MAKLLIVDDEPATLRMLAHDLEKEGHQVSVAYSGPEALQTASAERPDTVLLDVMMPEMDGIEVCRRLKADAELHSIPVILITANDRDEDMIDGLDAGADDYITKPFNRRILAARLRCALRVKRTYDSLSQAKDTLRQKDEELRQSHKLEAVGQLAGGIAHEFNNLLQAIGGYTKYAMADLSPEEQPYQDLERVLQAADRAARVTRELLTFGRRQVLERKNVDPNEVVTDLTKMMKPLIGEHIDLELILGQDVGILHADPGQMQQMLLNLCINARDAMPFGGRLIIKTERVVLTDSFCACHPGARPGPHVLLSVSDTGCGMSPEVREHVFEPFFTTKEVGEGTGLGLATVYGIVQQHGGTIHVYSEPGAGATFKVHLPNVETAVDGEQSEAPRAVAGGTEMILVAEDEQMVRDLTVRILQEAGYTVLAAADGEEALRVFKENREEVSLVMLDAIMPRLTGHEVYRRIMAECPDVKVVFCSGYDPETSRSTFIRESDLRLLEKPFDPYTLLQTVREVLDTEESCQVAQTAS